MVTDGHYKSKKAEEVRFIPVKAHFLFVNIMICIIIIAYS